MQSGSKRVSAFAVFKAKKEETPKKQSGHVRKPSASTPIGSLVRQGKGQLKKLRNSTRGRKEKKATRSSDGSRPRASLPMDMDVDDNRATASTSTSDQPREMRSDQKKRKSPYTTTPENSQPRKSRKQTRQQSEPQAKRLKFQDAERENGAPSGEARVADTSLQRDSLQHGRDVFSWLIAPFKQEDFFKNLFERKPLLLKRHNLNYFSDIFSSEELHNILKENDLQFTRNIDVTTYTDGKRETHNPVGRAYPQVVWDYYKNDCSVRVLNPQTYSTRVWQILAALQEFFGCFVGANIYMTPPGSQGFAPHYDDIEAFVLQLEGKKHWKLYNQRSKAEVLPRFSSGNFTDDDIGQPILDTTLEAGDLLYFPKGVIHQANTPSETHSLHITISACQKHTWGDLMEAVLKRALHTAQEEDVEFRKSLPTDYLNYMGVAHTDLDDERRQPFMKKIGDLFSKLIKCAPIDDAVDKMSLEFIHTSLPPVLEAAEEANTVFGSSVSCKKGAISAVEPLREDTLVRLVRRNALRLVLEKDKVLVYYSVENSRVYKEKEIQFFEIPNEAAPGVEYLLHSYPDYVQAEDLLAAEEEYDEDAVHPLDLAQVLYDKGLLVTKYKLEATTATGSGTQRGVTIHHSR